MINSVAISAINKVVKSYFDKHNTGTPIPAKDLMPQFIAAGIFPKDEKGGLPIRKVLRQLDKTGQLPLIPYVFPQRKQKNTNWFFTASKGNLIPAKPVSEKKVITENKPSRQNSDEAYVIDLCDEIFGEKAIRQHKFDFLLGDKNSTGVQRKLPVDAYYPSLNLVIEYREVQHTKPVTHFDKPHINTVSGVHRGEQRKIYDQRRRDVLPKHGIRLVEISCEQFTCDNKGRIIRTKEDDKKTLKHYLINHKS